MDIPSPGVVRKPNPHFDQTLDQSSRVKVRVSCETVEKGWSSADFPPMKKLPTKVNSAIKIT